MTGIPSATGHDKYSSLYSRGASKNGQGGIFSPGGIGSGADTYYKEDYNNNKIEKDVVNSFQTYTDIDRANGAALTKEKYGTLGSSTMKSTGKGAFGGHYHINSGDSITSGITLPMSPRASSSRGTGTGTGKDQQATSKLSKLEQAKKLVETSVLLDISSYGGFTKGANVHKYAQLKSGTDIRGRHTSPSYTSSTAIIEADAAAHGHVHGHAHADDRKSIKSYDVDLNLDPLAELDKQLAVTDYVAHTLHDTVSLKF